LFQTVDFPRLYTNMPRRRQHTGRSRRRSRPMGRRPASNNITVLRFRAIQSISTSSTPTFISLSNLSNASSFPSTRVYRMASNFTLFRFVHLRIVFLDNTLSTSCGISFQPASQMNNPATFTEMSEGERFSASLIGSTVPSVLSIPRSVLLGENGAKWFTTNSGSTSPQVQGNLFFGSGASATVTFIMYGTVEFCGSVSFAYTSIDQLNPVHYIESIEEEKEEELEQKIVFVPKRSQSVPSSKH
jgi:hypothetical protein